MTNTESELISLDAALRERGNRLSQLEGMGPIEPMTARPFAIQAVKDQIRDFENRKHELLNAT